MASDVLADKSTLPHTDDVKRRLLRLANVRHTNRLPSVLTLYVGMVLSLCSKDCQRLSLMHGAVAELVEIFFADAGRLPSNVLAGEPNFLRYMPTTLLVRVRDSKRKLPDRMLPAQ